MAIEKVNLNSADGQTELRDTPASITAYANVCNILVAEDEVILQFGLRDASNPNTGVAVAKIYLGPNHAKRIGEVLGKTLESFTSEVAKLLMQLQEEAQKAQPEK